jgi:hypothetical protein
MSKNKYYTVKTSCVPERRISGAHNDVPSTRIFDAELLNDHVSFDHPTSDASCIVSEHPDRSLHLALHVSLY